MSSPNNNGDGYATTSGPETTGSDYNAFEFLIQSALSRISTATLVRIVACSNAGGLSPIGTVDIQPLVNQIDGAGNGTPHGIVYGLLYFRLMGGSRGIIIDPVPGDIGWCIFADRDVSSARANGKPSNPGSRRRFSKSDGFYLGGAVAAAPSTYVQFAADGSINIVSPVGITLQAPLITLNGQLVQGVPVGGGSSYAATLNGPLTVTEEVTAAGIPLSTHLHSDAGGTGDSGPPIP